MSRRVLLAVAGALLIASPAATGAVAAADHELCVTISANDVPADIDELRAGLGNGSVALVDVHPCPGVSADTAATPTAGPDSGTGLGGIDLAQELMHAPGSLGMTLKGLRSRWNKALPDARLDPLPEVTTNQDGTRWFSASAGGVETLGVLDGDDIASAAVVWQPYEGTDVYKGLDDLHRLLTVSKFSRIIDPGLEQAVHDMVLTDLGFPLPDESWMGHQESITRGDVTYSFTTFPDSHGVTTAWLIANDATP